MNVPRPAPFLSDVPADEALATWLAAVPERLGTIELDLADALGRVTAAPVWALRSSPAFDAAAMDGIALRASDTFGATETSPRSVERFAVIDTGDALPDECNAVVMREQLHWVDGVRKCGPPLPPGSMCGRSARTSARPNCSCPRAIGSGPSISPPPARPATRD